MSPFIIGLAIGTGAYVCKELLKSLRHQNSLAKLTGGTSFVYFPKGGFQQTMTREEAYKILDLKSGADMSTIKSAHKRIMIINHPDKGGSPYLASKINEAKELLEK